MGDVLHIERAADPNEDQSAVNGGLNPRISGAGLKIGTKLAVELLAARGRGDGHLSTPRAAGGGGQRCAWHGHWIGGESPSRGEVVATASRRQLHAVPAVVRRQRWRREAVWGRSPRRTAAPNASEPLSKPDRPGQRVFERDAQNPSEAGAVLGAGAAGHSVSLPREVCVGPP